MYYIALDITDMVHAYLRHVPNGCEIDLTIPEDFSVKDLLEFIEAFIKVGVISYTIYKCCIRFGYPPGTYIASYSIPSYGRKCCQNPVKGQIL